MPRHLPVLKDEPASSLRADGTRNFVHPADVDGRFTRRRYVVFGVLMAVMLALPLVRINGRPALFLDVAHRQFFLFGQSFHAQDFWLAFFLATGLGFSLIVVTTLWGRVWCGYACPQTVFLEGIYRRVERALEGPRNERIKRNAGPWTFDKLWRKTLKHAIFVAVSLFLGHTFLSYFVSVPALLSMVSGPPSAHPEAFAWVMGASALMYFNFAWFREQLCLIVCPYGRLQSAMTDDDTLVIGYDRARGEPRGKAKDESAGDCVDCGRCVAVCPTGIDIRNGLQIECIGCAACVDACDDVMTKLGWDRGLIRYDSLNGFASRPKRFFRPRVYLYAVLGAMGLVAATLAFQARTPFEAALRRASTAPFVVQGEEVLNPMRLRVANKLDEPQRLRLEVSAPPGVEVLVPELELSLSPHETRHVSVVARAPRGVIRSGQAIRMTVESLDEEGETEELELRLVGPAR